MPTRTCIGCRSNRPAYELIRVSVQGKDLSTGRFAGGRGAWLCPEFACFERANKRRAFTRALRIEVPNEAVERLSDDLSARLAFSQNG